MRFVKKITNHRGLLFSLLLVIFLVMNIFADYFLSSENEFSLTFYGALLIFPYLLIVNGVYNFLFFRFRTTQNTWIGTFNDVILRTVLGFFVYFILSLVDRLFIPLLDNIEIIWLGLLLLGSYVVSMICNNRFIRQSTSWYVILGDSLCRSALFAIIMFILFIYGMSQIT